MSWVAWCEGSSSQTVPSCPKESYQDEMIFYANFVTLGEEYIPFVSPNNLTIYIYGEYGSRRIPAFKEVPLHHHLRKEFGCVDF